MENFHFVLAENTFYLSFYNLEKSLTFSLCAEHSPGTPLSSQQGCRCQQGIPFDSKETLSGRLNRSPISQPVGNNPQWNAHFLCLTNSYHNSSKDRLNANTEVGFQKHLPTPSWIFFLLLRLHWCQAKKSTSTHISSIAYLSLEIKCISVL